MKLSQRQLWLFGLIFVAVIVIITIVAAPTNNKLLSGSTYGKDPDGYGAWYQYMLERETPVLRWQKPISQLTQNHQFKKPITLLQIIPQSPLSFIVKSDKDWVKKGNNLVILGIKELPTEAPFTSLHSTKFGQVKIETTRRNQRQEKALLKDKFGTIIWEETIGKGKIIYATTPYLAANAYQKIEGNFALLAELVSQNQGTILVDEYSHGYKDQDSINNQQQETVITYFIKTPIFVAIIQVLIMIVIIFISGLKRWGQPVVVSKPVIENSQAYIEALAGVLQKAESTDFVLDMLGKEEQRQLQMALGLGTDLVDRETLLTAWKQYTGNSVQPLNQVLSQRDRAANINQSLLLEWLLKWQNIHKMMQK